MKYRVIAALAVVVCFAVFFQNCGMNVRFASVDGQLLAKNVQDSDGENDIQGDPDVVPTATPSPKSTPPSNQEVMPTPGDETSPTSTPSPSPTVSADSPAEDEEGGPLNFVCVLEGPGQSTLLGYVDNKLHESKSTPDTVCTTKRGCEEIVSLKFDVKEAVERQYCSSNKHVIKADEATLRLLIGD